VDWLRLSLGVGVVLRWTGDLRSYWWISYLWSRRGVCYLWS
jgi:hypothetical protein